MTYIPSAPRFYSPSAPLKAALSALTGYDPHVSALDAIKAPLAAAQTAVQDAQATSAQAASELAAVLLTADSAEAAETIEERSREAAHAADAEFTAAAKVKLLEAAEQQLGIELDDIIRGGYSRLLGNLNTILQNAYSQSRQLGLQGIHDAEDAIAAGKADQWQTMVELRTIIFQVRDAQALLVGRLGSHDAIQRLKTWGALRNYAELWPGHAEAAGGIRWGREDLTPPWPTVSGDPDPAGLHAWILENPEAEPWVPTDVELAAAVKEARAAVLAAHAAQDA